MVENNELKIRSWNPKAIAELHKLMLEHKTDGIFFPENVEDMEKSYQYQAILLNNLIIGITAYKVWNNRLVQTMHSLLFKDYRGKGYGKRVSAMVEEILREEGFKRITCSIYTDNFSMLFIKLKQGFLIEGLLRDCDETGRHHYILGKTID